MGLIVIMGSGETAPPMVRTHRDVFERVGDGLAALLDTPFGFQENADDLVAKTQAYFAQSVGRPVEAARWRRADAPTVERETALATLAQARWVFAGPGSPTYALRHWLETPVPQALADVVGRGGALVVGSAAAVTAGSFAVPVYEIYKAGADPQWAEGLDLLAGLAGMQAAVIPHFDNAEGGTHDTRFCYLGRRRLDVLEAELPDDVGVLGVDEHTALLVDLDDGVAEVRGNATVSVWRRGPARVLPAGTRLPIAELAAQLRGEAPASSVPAAPAAEREPGAAPSGVAPDRGGRAAGGVDSVPPSLRAETEQARERFDAAVDARDADGCVAAILGLEEALSAWSSDTLQSSDADRARRELRAMVVRLGELARLGARDPREVAGPYVEALLALRASARAAGDFATADGIRARLADAGVEVRDTPAGPEWHLDGGRG